MKVDYRYEFGDVLEDVVTGYTGTVMVAAIYSTGCTHYGLAPKTDKEGKLQSWEWLDESRLRLVQTNSIFNKSDIIIKESIGGPSPSGPE